MTDAGWTNRKIAPTSTWINFRSALWDWPYQEVGWEGLNKISLRVFDIMISNDTNVSSHLS